MADPNAVYPPPQKTDGYPQADYPPPQQGYAPDYPPQQGYQPPQPGFTAAAPPPYPNAPPPQQQQTSTNVVVVQQQPRPVTTVVYTRRYGTNDHGLLFAIIASCCVFWFGGWVGLFCTIPAIFYALNAQQEEANGNLVQMRQHHNLSLILSVVGLVVGFAVFFVWVIASAAARNS